MKQKLIVTLLTSVCLMGTASVIHETTPQTVQAAVKGKVQVKGTKKVRLYTNKGKKKYLAYKIGNNSQWLLAKNAKLVKKTAATQNYVTATMKMPSGYTKASLLQAYKGKPSASFIQACMKGMEQNDFSRVSSGESKADQKMINLADLSASEQKELAEFSLCLINSARSQLGLKPWVYSSGVESLANSIAQEYEQNGKSIKDGDHYVAGIVRACKKHGLELNDNYVEDMAGFSTNKKIMSMAEMKRNIYFGLKQMIFGFAGAGENQRNDKSLYREWEHAGDLFNTQGSRHDGDYNYYGFSISKTGNIYSMHFISVPSFVVNSSEYNKNFKI